MKSKIILIALILISTKIYAVKFTQEILTKTANEQNADLPMRVDGYSWLESVLTLDNRISQFIYKVDTNKLTKALKSKNAKTYINTTIRQATINSHCSTPGLREMMNDGVTFLHAYYDMEAKFIAEIKVTKKNCH